MSQTGHKSSRVFFSYYQPNKQTMSKVVSNAFNNIGHIDKDRMREIEVVESEGDLTPQTLTLKDKILQLKELVDIGEMSQSEFTKKKKELISSFS